MGNLVYGSITAVTCLVFSSCLVQATIYSVGGQADGWFVNGTQEFNGQAVDFQEWANEQPFKFNDDLDFGHPPPAPPPVQPSSATPNSQTSLVLSTEVLVSKQNVPCSNGPTPPQVPPDANPVSTRSDDGRPILIYTLNITGVWYFYAGTFFTRAESCNMKFFVDVFQQVPGTQGRGKHNKNIHVATLVGSLSVSVVVIALLVAALWVRRRRTGHGGDELDGSDSEMSMRPMFGVSPIKQFWNTFTKIPDDVVVDVDWPISGTMAGPRRFSLKELRVATQSFSPEFVIGEGGFGTVYRGALLDSPGLSVVAVKRLSQYAKQGVQEFMAEMNIISQLRHRNLVPLLGWCDEGDELLLVYEYMTNGDLDDLIFGNYGEESLRESLTLPWKHRKNILCGVARALVYLHEEWEQRVVHRDVKTSNVMLDSQFNARLGDFGLARLCSHSQAPRTTLVAGTIGYLAPEFSLTGKATDKTDVYAFGVVILEVLSARRPLTMNCILVDWVWELHKEDQLVLALDPKLDPRTEEDEKEMKLYMQVGLLCSQLDALARPDMRTVLNVLTGQSEIPSIPKSKPVAYYAEAV